MKDREKNEKKRKYEVTKKCCKCRKEIVLYNGSDSIHGNIYTGASDCEVKHYYICDNPKCGYSWSENA